MRSLGPKLATPDVCESVMELDMDPDMELMTELDMEPPLTTDPDMEEPPTDPVMDPVTDPSLLETPESES